MLMIEVTAQPDALDWLHATYDKQSNERNPTVPSAAKLITLSDVEIISKANENFAGLFAGDTEDYPSASEADLALLNRLSHYSDDATQLDRIFRQSGLMRKKWDDARGAQTYGEISIAKALTSKLCLNGRSARSEQTERNATSTQILTAGFRFVHAAEILAAPKPIEWLIRNVFEQGTLSLLFGPSGVAKTFLALSWSFSIATGRDWNGSPVARGCVFYIAGEGLPGIGRRIRALEIHHGVMLGDAPLFISTAPAALMDSSSAQVVAKAVEELVMKYGIPKLVIVDTFARNMGDGDENSNSDVGKYISNLDAQLRARLGVAVLIVHHSGHSATDRSRGASALKAAMDHEFRLEAGDGCCTLTCTKNKEGKEPEALGFRLETVALEGWLDDTGEVMTSAVLVSTGNVQKNMKKKLSAANQIALDALNVCKEKGEVSIVGTVSEHVWRERCYAAGISDGDQPAKAAAFRRSRDALVKLELIQPKSGSYP